MIYPASSEPLSHVMRGIISDTYKTGFWTGQMYGIAINYGAMSSGDTKFFNHGLCRDEDPEIFFPISAPGTDAYDKAAAIAKAVCMRCSVTDKCLQWAIDGGVDDGIFGATTPEERRMISTGNHAGRLIVSTNEVSARLDDELKKPFVRRR